MKSEPKGFDIRFTEDADLLFLQQVFVDAKEREPFPFQTDQETDEALKNWVAYGRYKASLTGVVDGEAVALGTLFLLPYRKVAHHCSFQVIVKKEKRRRGIGFSMVKNLIHLAKTRFFLEMLYGEIYPPNSAIRLLQAHGFKEIVRQDHFFCLKEKMGPRVLLSKELI